ncbi:NAC domain-containing protein JA2-like [Cornus florida]|uniref:NAC domain-containing protein JA2-like n=1 Tax=Cornus florida TaxID=4283 RepID=UPI00289EB242|nr:NAC domain-containing protein JA2-like [Cornus florida]XP_059653860.1 NAC domain-containing protein JA2-like [Cornus florida]
MPISSTSLPLGFRFKPTNEELIDYLWSFVHGFQQPSNAVVEKKVQELEPCFLIDDTKCSEYSEGYYYVKREKKSAKENGKRPSRKLRGGWWKATQGDKLIPGKRKGYMKSLKFHSYKDSNPICNKCSKSDWIMHEFRLDSDKFQEWVLCRIKRKQNKGAKMEILTSNTQHSCTNSMGLSHALPEQELPCVLDQISS